MREKVFIIKRSSAKFPKLLKQIPDPPNQLYCRGNADLLTTECLAVVGTRKMTDYGRQAVEHIVPPLARGGFAIVSGLALGVDAAAHRATLDAGGPAIAVLAAGVGDDSINPRSNFRLAMEILDRGGLLISEDPDGNPSFKGTFPRRNRIISGLAMGTLVIEADEKSGSLITGRLAADQNRDVFAVPGNIFSPLARGTNWLIKQGAKAVTSAQDILESYGRSAPSPTEAAADIADPTQKELFNLIIAAGSATSDEIILASGKSASDVSIALAMLEIAGLVKSIGNGKYGAC